MKKIFAVCLLLVTLAFPAISHAQILPYVINNFDSEIVINKDSSIVVTETIKVDFNESRHGIFRDLPVVYRTEDKVINSRLAVMSVVDENGKPHKYEVSRLDDGVRIKIGDPDSYVDGKVTYVISYRVRNVVQRYDGYDELYWNVLGAGWDTQILAATARVVSDYAEIKEVSCLSGTVSSVSFCRQADSDASRAQFSAGRKIGNGEDMSIVVALNPENDLVFAASLIDLISDYWGYPLAFLPIVFMWFAWHRRGRDEKNIGDNVYYDTGKGRESVPAMFRREHLPMVYHPIDGLTPAEIGTLADERVDINDVVGEIIELGRLKYLSIETMKKRFAKDDYIIKKIKDTDNALRGYQKYLHESIFSFGDGKEVRLSELNRKFYTKLDEFKNKLYEELQSSGYFFDRPDKVRAKWMAISVIVSVVCAIALFVFKESNFDFLPLIILVFSSLASLFFAYHMPRKTAKGYAYYRQASGLAFYLKKGKWREEIKEKHLFLDEILPLAISLGVVKKLAKDMNQLGVAEPSYFKAHGSAWGSSFNSFSSKASASLVAGASSSGSWSGGSGFSGGSSGGGFGGGGGGSW